MINFFKNKRKRKFLNRLKYGQDKKPIYTMETLSNALLIGDDRKAQEILDELVKRVALTGKLGK